MRNEYLNAVRDLVFNLNRQGVVQNVLVWQVQQDEANDPTLLSFRAYGNRNYTDVVLVCAGVSGIWERLPERVILLPRLPFIRNLRKKYGIE